MTETPVTLVLADAVLPDGGVADIHIAGALIAAMAPPGTDRPSSAEVFACAGKLVAPSFVEGHIHLDKTLLGLPFVPHRVGATVPERIAAEKALRRTLALPVTARGGRLIEQVAAFGTGSIRSHVDIDTEVGLAGLHALLDLRAAMPASSTCRSSPFPKAAFFAIRARPTCSRPRWARAQLSSAGSIPAGIDGDVGGHLDVVFGLAQKHGAGIDIHLHDAGPLGAFELRDIAARTSAAGLQGRVAVSHAYALGALDEAELGRTTEGARAVPASPS